MKKNSQTIYILHGWSTDKNNKEKWSQFLQILSKSGVQTVFLPIPGLDFSLSKPMDLDDFVNWLHQELEKKLAHLQQFNSSRSQDIILLGHSFGGQIALRFALKYPHLVDRLILIDSAGIRDNSWYQRLRRGIYRAIAKAGKLFFYSPILEKFLYSLAGSHDYRKADKNLKKTMQKVIAVDLAQSLGKINAPTTIIWGEKDQVTPVWMGRKIHKAIPHSNFEVIKNARHSPQFTHSQQVADIITKLIIN